MADTFVYPAGELQVPKFPAVNAAAVMPATTINTYYSIIRVLVQAAGTARIRRGDDHKFIHGRYVLTGSKNK